MRDLRIVFRQLVALTILAGPVFAGNESNYRYLALGDSVSFGYDPTVAVTLPPETYVGYPETVADFAHLLQSKKEVNLSCPGQSSLSFLNAGVQDFGCEWFKNNVGLHTKYPGSQLDFAVSQLQDNKDINLVTLSIGGDDLLLLQRQCSSAPDFAACVEAALPSVLHSYGTNLAQILAAIRSKYQGDLMLVKYYSPSTDPLFIKAIQELNKVMTDVDTMFKFGVKFADGFTAFQTASAPFHGDPCQAGLLVHVGPTTCDVHPSADGQRLLASTVLSAISGK